MAFLNTSPFRFIFFTGLIVFCFAQAAITEEYFRAGIPFLFLFFYWAWRSFTQVFFLLLITIPFSFTYNFSSDLATDIPDEFVMWSVTVLFLFNLIFTSQISSKKIFRHPLLFFLALSFLWIIVTLAFSTDIIITLKFLLAKTWYISAFALAPLIIFKKRENIKKAFSVFAVSFLVVVAIILLKHAFYNFDFAHVNDAVHPFFLNHVTYSAMLVCVLPVFLAFFRLTDSKRKRFFISIIILILLIALAFSYSRGAWLALLVGLAAYWLIKRKLLLISFLAAVVIVISLLFWIKSNDRYLNFSNDFKTTIFHKNFREHLIATYKLKDVSTAERFYRWIAGVRMIKHDPLVGFGPNTFYNNYKPYAIPAFKTWVSDNREHSTVHNYFLLITIEQGIPGLIFFLVLLGAMIYYSQRVYHRTKDIFYKTIAATAGVIITMIIVVNFLSDLIETDKIGSIFFLCLSVLMIADINTRKDSDFSPDA